jgi:hypothetical protein
MTNTKAMETYSNPRTFRAAHLYEQTSPASYAGGQFRLKKIFRVVFFWKNCSTTVLIFDTLEAARRTCRIHTGDFTQNTPTEVTQNA